MTFMKVTDQNYHLNHQKESNITQFMIKLPDLMRKGGIRFFSHCLIMGGHKIDLTLGQRNKKIRNKCVVAIDGLIIS